MHKHTQNKQTNKHTQNNTQKQTNNNKQGPDSRVSLSAVEAAITPSTFLLVGSAPQYPHGVVR